MLLVEFDHAGDLKKIPQIGGPPLELYSRDGSNGALALADTDGTTLDAGQRHIVTQLFSGGKYGNAAGPFLFHVALWTPKDYREEFLAWYEVEHLPMLLEAQGWDGCRFVEEQVDKGLLFHALHQLSERSALESQQRKSSRSTPWFQRLARNPWFDAGFVRTLYQRIPTT